MCVLKCRLVEKQAGEQKEVPYVSDGTVSSLLGAGASSLPLTFCLGPLLRGLGPSWAGASLAFKALPGPSEGCQQI